MSETRITVDISALHIDHYPRLQQSWKKLRGMGRYIRDVSDAVSRLLNVIVGGNGADTLSSQAFRTPGPFWELLRKWLDIIFSPRTRNHCQKMHWRCLERSKALLANR
jgi:hypothetical protein